MPFIMLSYNPVLFGHKNAANKTITNRSTRIQGRVQTKFVQIAYYINSPDGDTTKQQKLCNTRKSTYGSHLENVSQRGQCLFSAFIW